MFCLMRHVSIIKNTSKTHSQANFQGSFPRLIPKALYSLGSIPLLNHMAHSQNSFNGLIPKAHSQGSFPRLIPKVLSQGSFPRLISKAHSQGSLLNLIVILGMFVRETCLKKDMLMIASLRYAISGMYSFF